eukprot:758707-Hanusia_phi.AAC.11
MTALRVVPACLLSLGPHDLLGVGRRVRPEAPPEPRDALPLPRTVGRRRSWRRLPCRVLLPVPCYLASHCRGGRGIQVKVGSLRALAHLMSLEVTLHSQRTDRPEGFLTWGAVISSERC